MKKVYFKTFGCRTNQFDTQVMIKSLKDYIVVPNERDADIVVVNSCTVTNGADVSTRSYVNKHSDKKIIFTGCGALSKGKELLADNRVSVVFGHSEKSNISEFIQKENFIKIGDLDHIDDIIVSDFVGKSRAFIKIQEGCDFECSYCIIPSVRGGARSHDESLILSQIKLLADNGYKEFILTGTNVGSYGKDKDSTIAKLLKKISLIKGVKRVRVGSLEPIQIDDEFIELLSESWMAKHLHIALQHTSNTMLNIMKRRNNFEDDIKLLQTISSKGYAIGSDYIVGHSGESENVWREAVDNIHNLPLTHIHPFTYSPRDHTHSATLKNHIRGDIAKQRLKELKSIIDEKNYQFRLQKKPLHILVESYHDGVYSGYDQFFNKIKIKSDKDIKSTWILVDDYVVTRESNIVK